MEENIDAMKKINEEITSLQTKINTCVNDIKLELEKLYISEPCISELYDKNNKKSKLRKPIKVIRTLAWIFFGFILGLGLHTLFLFKQFPLPDPLNKINWFSFFPALIFTLITGLLMFFIQKVEQLEFKRLKSVLWVYLSVLIISLALSIVFSFVLSEHIVSGIIIIASFFLLYIIIVGIMLPFMPEKIKNDFDHEINQLNELLQKLGENREELFKKEIVISHSKIEAQINELGKKIKEKEAAQSESSSLDAYLINKLELSTLESLKLELVESSSKALHLTRNWQFVEITQNLFERIMSPNNGDEYKHITLIGDLSFLSKKEGLRNILSVLANTDKKFDIYFMRSDNNGNISEILKDNLKELIGVENCEVIQRIKIDNIHFKKVQSPTFTGLGYVGFKKDCDKQDYDLVYAYISTDLLNSPTEAEKDIVNANPFVFKWTNNTHFFRDFKMSLDNAISEDSLTNDFKNIILEKLDG